MKRAFIAVEGPHDVELVGALLASLDGTTQRVRFKSEVDESWHGLIPTTFPVQDDIARRVPVPVFFCTATHTVAVMVAEGDKRLIEVIEESIAALDVPLDMLGVVMDADRSEAQARWTGMLPAASKLGLALPLRAGEVGPGPPRFGAFVLPDNASPGTLEVLLLDAAEVVYPTLLEPARAFVDGVKAPIAALSRDERRAFQKPSGREKATVACLGAVLKPGKAIQASIQDNRWFKDPAALALPRIAGVRAFLAALLDLPIPADSASKV